MLGPVDVRKWELEPARFPHAVTVEEWVLPDESDLIEVSVKVPPEQAGDAERAFRALLAESGIDPTGDQPAKARTLLEFFAARLNEREDVTHRRSRKPRRITRPALGGAPSS